MATVNTLELEIEVTVKEGDTSTQRGELLEKLVKRILAALQHQHISTNVRLPGCEIDVLAEDKQSGAKVLVECKAYRDKSISGDTLTKMLGNLMVFGYSSAWLITTAKLGKDARGLLETIKSKSTEQRQQLRVYEPQNLIEFLISTGQVINPEQLSIPKSLQVLRTRTLLITDIGEYWAVTAVGAQSGIADTVMVYDAQTGDVISNPSVIQQLSERDSNLRSLQWISGEDELAASALTDASLKLELDNIAPVPIADDWSDYRPARPQDFVGRDELLRSIMGYFDEARTGTSKTRLLAIKAPSGWGKSSFLVKLRSTCANTRNKEKFFLFAVDCRTATSPRYPELALKRCFDEAIKSGFVSTTEPSCRITSTGQPFSDPSIQSILQKLREQNKLIILFFDQFEEITTKQELSELFTQIRMLCAAVESAAENVVLGFSWKTDGSIPADHPAYHVWHSFADRRREFDLPLFSKRETNQLLSRLSNELHQPIEPSLRRLLAEHCQGYPWLLKKLCVHVFRVLQTQPARQRELLERALDVEALFQKDLADLDATQISCLEKIAHESPADHFRIIEQYGETTVTALIQRRLVVRNSGKLVLYWDIFRDYVLTKQVPAIPTQYMPASSPASTRGVLDCLSPRKQSSLTEIGRQLNLKAGTLDNIARDLVMMGICQYDRKNARLKLVHNSRRETLAAGFRFFSSHALLKRLIEKYGQGFKGVSLSLAESTFSDAFDPRDYTEQTIRVFTLRFIAWLQAFRIISIDSDDNLVHDQNQVPPTDFSQLQIETRRREIRLFKGEAPPTRVLELLVALQDSSYTIKPSDRNSLYVLNSLRLISSTANPRLVEKTVPGNEELWLASKVIGQPAVRVSREVLRNDPNASALDIGDALSKLSANHLSEASKRRYGSGLLVWVNWIHDLVVRASKVDQTSH